jgi:hypothetical protein
MEQLIQKYPRGYEGRALRKGQEEEPHHGEEPTSIEALPDTSRMTEGLRLPHALTSQTPPLELGSHDKIAIEGKNELV